MSAIVGQYPVVTRVNTDVIVVMDNLKISGTGPFTLDIGSATNCVVTQDSGVDDEIIVTPNDEFYGVATARIRLEKTGVFSDWFLLNIGVRPYSVPGKGVPIDTDGVTVNEGRHREERRIRKSNIVSKNPESMRRGQPFYSTEL